MPFLLFVIENPCSDTHILSKIRPFSQNVLFPCSFFQIFHQKTPAVMSIFGQKNTNSVKTVLFYGPKKSIKFPFFQKIARKYPIISTNKIKLHFKIPYNIKQKNVKNVKKVQRDCKIPYNIHQKNR